MRQRYFFIEPKNSDPDTFCCFTVGSDRVRASIQIYADLWMLREVAAALVTPPLKAEGPMSPECTDDDPLFYFYLTVLPHEGRNKNLRFRIFQDWLDNGAPFRADIRFALALEETHEFANELQGMVREAGALIHLEKRLIVS